MWLAKVAQKVTSIRRNSHFRRSSGIFTWIENLLKCLRFNQACTILMDSHGFSTPSGNRGIQSAIFSCYSISLDQLSKNNCSMCYSQHRLRVVLSSQSLSQLINQFKNWIKNYVWTQLEKAQNRHNNSNWVRSVCEIAGDINFLCGFNTIFLCVASHYILFIIEWVSGMHKAQCMLNKMLIE